jgi:hypothetical protein
MTLKRLARGFGFWALLVAVALVMGVHFTEGEQSGAPPTWKEHWDVASTIITILFGLAVWFSSQKLKRIEMKFDLLFEWKGFTDVRLTALETEHRMRTGHDCHPMRRDGDFSEGTSGG